jgi:predicted dithiol-disulfide oxidoreductase (DUF899 family)
VNDEIRRLETEIYELKQQLSAARRQYEREEVGNYTFQDREGAAVTLAALFGDKSDLLVVHNMGKDCSYCTLWADGFNGFVPHLEDRTAFVLASPDSPQTLSDFAASRDWKFRVVSVGESPFSRDMEYQTEDGYYHPGVSAFHKSEDGAIYRVGRTVLGPGDDFCSVWHLFDLLAEGANGWEPQYVYGETANQSTGTM